MPQIEQGPSDQGWRDLLAVQRRAKGGTVMPSAQSTWLPKPRTFWVWELGNAHARAIIQVDRVEWNGEEWWVHCRKLVTDAPISEGTPDESGIYANELERFWEACTPIAGGIEDLRERPADLDQQRHVPERSSEENR